MKKITLSKEFIKQFKVKLEQKEDSIDILIDADFLVYLNAQEVFAASNLRRDEKEIIHDDTTPLKDLLCDQIVFADQLGKGLL